MRSLFKRWSIYIKFIEHCHYPNNSQNILMHFNTLKIKAYNTASFFDWIFIIVVNKGIIANMQESCEILEFDNSHILIAILGKYSCKNILLN